MEMRRVDLANSALRTSPKLITGVNYQNGYIYIYIYIYTYIVGQVVQAAWLLAAG